MNDKERLEKILDNLRGLSWSTVDAPYAGVSKEQTDAIRFSVRKALKGTGYTEEDVIKGVYKEGDE